MPIILYEYRRWRVLGWELGSFVLFTVHGQSSVCMYMGDGSWPWVEYSTGVIMISDNPICLRDRDPSPDACKQKQNSLLLLHTVCTVEQNVNKQSSGGKAMTFSQSNSTQHTRALLRVFRVLFLFVVFWGPFPLSFFSRWHRVSSPFFRPHDDHSSAILTGSIMLDSPWTIEFHHAICPVQDADYR